MHPKHKRHKTVEEQHKNEVATYSTSIPLCMQYINDPRDLRKLTVLQQNSKRAMRSLLETFTVVRIGTITITQRPK
jgi:hypothetical protein